MVQPFLSSESSSEPPAQRVRYTFRRIMTGSDLSHRRLPVMEARSEEAGPRVWLTAAAHGDEVGGVVVIQEVFKRLRAHPLIRGSLHAFPLMNPIGFDLGRRQVMFSQEDLNRSFPGDADGSLAQRMAAHIFDEITSTAPAAVLDLHNDWIRSIPYCIIDPPGRPIEPKVHRRIEALARETDLLMIAESKPIEGSLSRALGLHGIPALTLELGESFVVNEVNVKLGVEVVWRILAREGLVHAMSETADPAAATSPPPAIPEVARGSVLTYSSRPFASRSGIVRFAARPGEIIRAGQTIAHTYNAFGKLRETIRADHDAIVLGYADTAIAYPGAPIMAFGLLPPPR